MINPDQFKPYIKKSKPKSGQKCLCKCSRYTPMGYYVFEYKVTFDEGCDFYDEEESDCSDYVKSWIA